jgi:pyruvate-ferredoxin/flavodoxin oxidoreductase
VRSLSGGGVGWLRRLWRRAAEEAAHPGSEAVLPVEQALGTLEALVCEGVVHRPGSAPSAEHARRWEPTGPLPRNAFGRPVQEEIGAGPRGSVSVATGMTLAGLRATAFVRGEELTATHEALRNAADRLAPLVVHVANGDAGHAGYHAVSSAGLVQVLAGSGQQALDLSLVARWVAERSLVPGLVATDGAAIERLQMPDEEIVRAYLGEPDEPLRSPTEAQSVLFGIERATLLRWFDPDRPVATGGIVGAGEAARARLGSRLFFLDHVRELARQGMEELGRFTGRPLSFVDAYRLDDAEAVLVAQGSAVQVARAVVEHLRRTRRWKLGVLGLTWLRPLPAAELAGLLKGRHAVAVIEAFDEPLASEPPLIREIEGAVGATGGWMSGTYAGCAPDPERLSALCGLLRQSERPRTVDLESRVAPPATGFPRRDALLQTLTAEYPALRDAALPEVESPALEPDEGRSAGLVGLEATLPADAVQQLAEAVASEGGPCLRGAVSRLEPGVVEARVRAAPADFPDPGPRSPVSALLVASGRPRDLGQPLGAVHPGGGVLVATRETPERLWATLPPAWRRTIQDSKLRLFAVDEGLEAGLEGLRGCLRGDEDVLRDAGKLRDVPWHQLPAPDEAERDLPRLVRRIEHTRASHDSLPRFWGEVAQPRQDGIDDGVPDPLQATGAVPAGASALEPNPEVSILPALDPDACTGCGRCWSACPDGAIGVTVLGTEALLTAASRVAGTQGKAADALRRGHRHLAGRLNGELAKGDGGALSESALREGWTWLSGRLGFSEEERPDYEAAFEATLQATARLRPIVTGPFFHKAEEATKSAGELLVLAVDPRACLGCGLCVAVCPEDALHPEERVPERISEAEALWRTWEELPDTAGATIVRVESDPDVGPLAAALLSRHCAHAQVGGGASEPGSGERLAGRLVAGLLEYHGQRRMAGLVNALEEERGKLEETLRERLAEGLSSADLDTLTEALSRLTPGRGALSDLGEHLGALGAPATFDRQSILRMAQLAGELEKDRQRLAEGEDGLGRARFGVVVTRGTVAEWAARFPRHPFFAPLTLAPTAQGVELARGIARGLAAEHVELVRMLRRAALEAKAPTDRPVQVEAIERLTWADLDAEDRAACPPLVLLGDDTALLEHGFESLTRLLASDLPVKVVLLDGLGRLGRGPEPALAAMAHRGAFVLSGSLAYPEHLARGLADALTWPGPALVHIHAPSPHRHGFPVDAALERAALAVESRAHVLFRYDPTAEGLFGLRASLGGNPAGDADWGELTLADWAVGEARFADDFEPLGERAGVPLAEWLALSEADRRSKLPTVEVDGRALVVGARMRRAAEDRLAIWNVLRELTGTASPFTEQIRTQVQQEVEAEQQAQLDALQAEHDAKLSELRSGREQEAISRLTERLMNLAGYAPKPGQKGEGP